MKKILILAGSPRIHGNSATLSEAFLKGALEAGHQGEMLHITQQDIHYCMGCNACFHTGKCVQKDGAENVLHKMIEADVIVFATPVYFYNMSAQMKTLIDRCCPAYTKLGNKDYYLILSAGEEDKTMMAHVLESFQGFFDCLEAPRVKDVIYGLGVMDVQDIQNSSALLEAYEAGRKI